MQELIRRRIRKVVEIFSDVASKHKGESDDKGVPQPMVDELQRRLTEIKAEDADLMAIRHTPFAYSHQPYAWLWLLHRVTNKGLINLNEEQTLPKMENYEFTKQAVWVSIQAHTVREILEQALDADWIEKVEERKGGAFAKHKFKSRLDVPFSESCALAISHRRLGSDDLTISDLDAEKMKRGFQVLATQFPTTFHDLTKEEAIIEPDDADHWLQCALWGERRFEA